MPSLIDKPRLMEKLKNFHDYVRNNNGQIGTKQRGIDLNFNKGDLWMVVAVHIMMVRRIVVHPWQNL